jgi:effector-binding domain-containing protein
MKGFPYYSASGDCDHSRIPEALCALQERVLESMTNARAELDPAAIARYLDAAPGTTWTLQVGYRILGDVTARPGTADTEDLGPFPCVAAVYQGNVDHVSDAVMLLVQTAQENGFEAGREYREHYLYRETPDSPSNVLLLQMGVAAPGGGAADLPATPGAVFGPVRVHTLAGYHFLYVDAETDWAGIETAFEDLLGRIGVCQRRADVMAVGTMRFSFRDADAPGMLVAEVGVPVATGTEAPEGGKVRDVAPVRVASLVLTGPYSGLARASELLSAAIEERGLTRTGEYGELYLHYDGDTSPNTITQVIHPLR